MKQRASIKRQKFLKFFIYLTVRGLRCVAGAFSSCGEQGILLIMAQAFSWRWFLLLWSMGSRARASVAAVRRLLIVGPRLLQSVGPSTWAQESSSWAPEHRLSSCGF